MTCERCKELEAQLEEENNRADHLIADNTHMHAKLRETTTEMNAATARAEAAEIHGMERAKQLFAGLYWGPFTNPISIIQDAIDAARSQPEGAHELHGPCEICGAGFGDCGHTG